MVGPSSSDLAVLAASHLPKVGPATLRAAIRQHRIPRLDALAQWRTGQLPSTDDAKLAQDAIAAAERSLSLAERNEVFLITLANPAYPPILAALAEAPPVLWVKGSLPALFGPSVAVVGTRDATSEGLSFARRLAKIFADKGLTVVSGLALGCDTAAHKGALDARGITVAVLAHGLHTVKPDSNRKLAEAILANGGAWVSEYPIGEPAYPQNFVQRNRIQVGLSTGVVVVETGREGGSMHTARFCLAANRPLAVADLDGPEDQWKDDVRAGTRLLATEHGATKLKTLYDTISFSEKMLQQFRAYSSRAG